jgi:hypothetical protein
MTSPRAEGDQQGHDVVGLDSGGQRHGDDAESDRRGPEALVSERLRS